MSGQPDLMMEVSGGRNMFGDRTSATAVLSLHRGAKNVLYCYVSAQYSMATSEGLDLSTLVETDGIHRRVPLVDNNTRGRGRGSSGGSRRVVRAGVPFDEKGDE